MNPPNEKRTVRASIDYDLFAEMEEVRGLLNIETRTSYIIGAITVYTEMHKNAIENGHAGQLQRSYRRALNRCRKRGLFSLFKGRRKISTDHKTTD